MHGLSAAPRWLCDAAGMAYEQRLHVVLKLRLIIIHDNSWDNTSHGYVVVWAVKRCMICFGIIPVRHKLQPFSAALLLL